MSLDWRDEFGVAFLEAIVAPCVSPRIPSFDLFYDLTNSARLMIIYACTTFAFGQENSAELSIDMNRGWFQNIGKSIA